MNEQLGRAGFNLLTTSHGLETAMALVAVVWGLVQLATAGVSLSSNAEATVVDLTAIQAFIGTYPLVLGLVGMIGLWKRWTSWRMVASLSLSPFWLLLSTYYLLAIPPMWGAVPIYGLDGIFSLIVYGRLRYGLDQDQ